jgi:limonene-1,2-epoxide hydrolase
MKTPNIPSRQRQHATAATFALFIAFIALGCAPPDEAEQSATEKANIEVVNDFMAAWSNPDEAMTFLAPDAAVRMIEDQPAVVGHAAIADVFKSFLTPGVTLKVETLETTARGPVVMNRRIDTMMTEGKPDQVFPVVGVFIVKQGKITEWADYLEK